MTQYSPQLHKPIEKKYVANAEIVLYQGDVKNLLNKIPDNSVDLVLSSPPYNMGKDYESRIEIEKYLEKQSKIISELYRVLRSTGSICWQVGNFIEKGEVYPLDIMYYEIFKKLGLKLRNRIIWRFGHGLHAQKRFSGRYETILWFTKSDEYVFNLDDVRIPSKYPGKQHHKGSKKGQLSGNPLGKNPSDIWEILQKEWDNGIWDIPNVKANHPEKTVHPCQFPIELVERCVLAFTSKHGVVLDPYVGTGSSIIGAIKNGRKAIGSEKNKEYFTLAQNRIQQYFQGILKLRPLGQPIYQPGNEKVSRIPENWIKDKSTIYYIKNEKKKAEPKNS